MKKYILLLFSISIFASDLIEVCINNALNKPTSYTATNADLGTITKFKCNYMGDINFTKVSLMANLKILEMRGNDLRKYNLNVISYLQDLESVKLNGNMLQGGFPALSSANLKYLDLATNGLYGEIPNSIGNLSKLEVLDLSNNGLNGEIPNGITNLTKLKKLYLQFNSFSKNIPTNIGNMASLQKLKLNHNNLRGTIPLSIKDLNLTQPSGLNLRDNCKLETEDNTIKSYINSKSSFYRGYEGMKSSGGRCPINALPAILYLLLDDNTTN